MGVPFNIAAYALLTRLLAQVTGMVADEFIWTGGDSHIYLNHVEGMRKQLERTPGPLPKLRINPNLTSLYDFTLEDLVLEEYHHQGKIEFEVSV